MKEFLDNAENVGGETELANPLNISIEVQFDADYVPTFVIKVDNSLAASISVWDLEDYEEGYNFMRDMVGEALNKVGKNFVMAWSKYTP